MWRPNTAKNPTKSCAKALAIFATCSWPSLCEQSELQCWRRNRRLCGPAQISAARTLLPISTVLSQIAWRLRRCNSGIARTFGEGLRRSTVAHFARKVRGDKYCGGQTRAKNPTKSCAKALYIFATCSWPSLCEQSELQCWRRNRRLCGPAQISAARTLLPISTVLSQITWRLRRCKGHRANIR